MKEKRIGAFFDFDKTLLDVESSRLGIKFLWDLKLISLGFIIKVLIFHELYKRNLYSDEQMAALLVKFYKGKKLEDFEIGATDFYHNVLKSHLAPNILAKVHEHKAQGHVLVIVSAGIRYILAPAVHDLGFDHLLCTDLEVGPDGLLTGTTKGPICVDRNKRIFAEHLAETIGIDLSASYAYGNHQSDIPLLELVGNPSVVEPTVPLLKVARQKGWPVLSFRA
jgi:HAD superfamily hydrolase (TIGR01490 family)